MESLMNDKVTIRVLMFPWLAYGHISPYLELAKRLADRNFFIYLCSTPANLSSIKSKISEKLALKIQLIELHLPVLPNLPASYHTTNGLPPHLMPVLKNAFEMSTFKFSFILKTIKPDLLIYDFLQPWAPLAAAAIKIPAVEFITSSSTMTAFMFHFFKTPDVEFPFPSIFYRDYEFVHRAKLLESTADEQVKEIAFQGIERSNGIVLVKGFEEVEGRYIDYLSKLLGKKVVPVGALVSDPSVEVDETSEVMDWLDQKGEKSTVFVSFGSEYFLKNDDMNELAHGLELSKVNFIWVVRFPKGEKIELEESLPEGFLGRVKGRGLVVRGWAPQNKILEHENIGGFISHCGCSSIMEGMYFGVPVIAMPMHLDQPINARLIEELGIGSEVVRNKFGRLDRAAVAAVIQQVVVDSGGESIRTKARALSDKMRMKRDAEIDDVVREFEKLCSDSKRVSQC
ncbi:beta-D-glucosyl crocetin beta-1,6-glucosyltransferase-like [Primulina huaijiensis]|uniref:beta-D-glucosyl crocetin beta-1,6-glucosyltransferase-like n=1 Tax=Primulina huaijiensis TaxID=1492673 RepID=UPI003CC6EE3B